MKKRVDPVMGPLVQRVITERPEDVSLFALRELRSHRNSSMTRDSASAISMPSVVSEVMEKEGLNRSLVALKPMTGAPAEAKAEAAAPAPAPAAAPSAPAAAPVVTPAATGPAPTPAPQPAPPPHKELTAEEMEMLDGVALPDDIDDAHDEILR